MIFFSLKIPKKKWQSSAPQFGLPRAFRPPPPPESVRTTFAPRSFVRRRHYQIFPALRATNFCWVRDFASAPSARRSSAIIFFLYTNDFHCFCFVYFEFIQNLRNQGQTSIMDSSAVRKKREGY